MIYIGIVGSRKRTERIHIREILRHFLLLSKGRDSEICLVSGGAKGIDTEAEQIADSLGIEKLIFKPKRNEYSIKGDDIYFERNKLIAEKSDILFAFPLNRKGGTMDTIKHFINIHGKNTDKLRIID